MQTRRRFKRLVKNGPIGKIMKSDHAVVERIRRAFVPAPDPCARRDEIQLNSPR